jgi:hypothetical protein
MRRRALAAARSLRCRSPADRDGSSAASAASCSASYSACSAPRMEERSCATPVARTFWRRILSISLMCSGPRVVRSSAQGACHCNGGGNRRERRALSAGRARRSQGLRSSSSQTTVRRAIGHRHVGRVSAPSGVIQQRRHAGDRSVPDASFRPAGIRIRTCASPRIRASGSTSRTLAFVSWAAWAGRSESTGSTRQHPDTTSSSHSETSAFCESARLNPGGSSRRSLVESPTSSGPLPHTPRPWYRVEAAGPSCTSQPDSDAGSCRLAWHDSRTLAIELAP